MPLVVSWGFRRLVGLLTRLSSQVGHKVQHQVEQYGIAHLVRNIREHRSDSLGGGMVKGILGVLIDDRALSV